MTDDEIEQEVKLIIMELMAVLHKHGIHEVNVGGLMRLIGVDNETAKSNDDDVIILDEKFNKYINQTIDLAETPDTNQTLH
jgi:hypothetical protein